MPSPVPSLNVATEQIESRMRYEAHVRELEAEISIEEAINQEVPRMRLDPGKGVVAAFEDLSTLKILPPQSLSVASESAGEELPRQCA